MKLHERTSVRPQELNLTVPLVRKIEAPTIECDSQKDRAHVYSIGTRFNWDSKLPRFEEVHDTQNECPLSNSPAFHTLRHSPQASPHSLAVEAEVHRGLARPDRSIDLRGTVSWLGSAFFAGN